MGLKSEKSLIFSMSVQATPRRLSCAAAKAPHGPLPTITTLALCTEAGARGGDWGVAAVAVRRARDWRGWDGGERRGRWRRAEDARGLGRRGRGVRKASMFKAGAET